MLSNRIRAHVRLTHRPRYSGRLRMWGQAMLEEVAQPGYTSIGRASLSSRRELLDTIIHEEAHHRLWHKAQRGAARAWNKIMDLFVEEAYVREVAFRFVRLQQHLSGVRRRKSG